MAQPTETESKLLEKFRQSTGDVPLNNNQMADMYLLTWIRARENDLRKAEDMLRKSIKWRSANEIDSISSWSPPENYKSEFPFALIGQDIEGRPVCVLCLGIWDIRKRVEGGERETYIRYVDQIIARVIQKIEDLSKQQFVIIIDMEQLSLRQFTSPSTLDTILETFKRFEANYPERLFSCYIINAPRIFPIAFRLVKPLLSGRTLKKIQIYNANAEKWKNALLSAIPSLSLPPEYGGVNTECGKDLNRNTDVQEIIVAAGGKHALEFCVDTPKSILRWEIETVDFDIGFAVSFQTEEVHGYSRLNSHLTKEEGQLICHFAGTYTVLFDNSYSRLRPKTLRYFITVQSNQSDENVD